MSDDPREWPPIKKQYPEKLIEFPFTRLLKKIENPTIEFDIPVCTCPWKVMQNSPKEVRGHHVNCPCLILKKHSPDDDCGDRGHFDIIVPDPKGIENAPETE